MALRQRVAEPKSRQELSNRQNLDIQEAFQLYGDDAVVKHATGMQVLAGKLSGPDKENQLVNTPTDELSCKVAGDCCRLRVHTIGGATLAVSAKLEWTVAQVKELLHESGSAAPLFQKLCLGTRLLGDDEDLSSLLACCGDVPLTLVVSLQIVTDQLQSSSARNRCRALATISNTFSPRNVCPAVVDIVKSCLSDHSARVRAMALNCLRRVVAMGEADESLITDISTCLQDDAAYVRECALLALGNLLPQGDQRLRDAVEACLQDAEAHVRCSALEKVEKMMDDYDSNLYRGSATRGWQALVEGLLFADSQ